jgi:hypothetical protein
MTGNQQSSDSHLVNGSTLNLIESPGQEILDEDSAPSSYKINDIDKDEVRAIEIAIPDSISRPSLFRSSRQRSKGKEGIFRQARVDGTNSNTLDTAQRPAASMVFYSPAFIY